MITIHTELTKSEFLSKLSQQAGELGSQIVLVESLPTFMDTPISLKLMAYQLQSYPRPISWLIEDENLRTFFAEAELDIIDVMPAPETEVSDNLTDQIAIFDTASHQIEPSDILNSYNALTNTGYTQSPLIADKIEPTLQIQIESTVAQVNTPSLLLDLNIPTTKQVEPQDNNSSDKFVSSTEDVIQPDMNTSSSTFQSTQNLDIWLERISASKDAITSLRKQPTNNSHQIQLIEDSETQVASQNNTFTKGQSQKHVNTNWLQSIIPRTRKSAIYTGVFCVLGILIIGLFFPANVYTLKIEAPQFQESVSLEFNEKDFEQSDSVINSTSLIDATGSAIVPTVRSTGSVSLLNPANGDIDLTNGKFLLVGSENQEYSVVYNSTLPQVFTIPARNDLNGPQIQFEIQSSGVGESYNVKAGTRFKIVNLKGERVCGSCYAVASSDILSLSDTGDKTASQADYNVLQNSVDGNLGIQIQKKIESKQSDDVFTHANWFRNINSTYNYTPSLGQVTDKVELDAEVTTKIYYLSKETVTRKIKESNPEIFTVESAAIISTEGQIQDTNSVITVQFAYSFTNEAPVEMNQVKEYLRNKDCDYGSNSVSREYPGVQALDCRITGLDMPGVPKSIDITVVEE